MLPKRTNAPHHSLVLHYVLLVFFWWLVILPSCSHGETTLSTTTTTTCSRTPGKVIVLSNTTKALSLSVVGRTTAEEEPSTVCLLWRITLQGARVPLARSYEQQDWEAYSSSSSSSLLQWDCQNDVCQTTLPPLADTLRYELISYTRRRELNQNEQAARFLEQTTFGPRFDEIRSLSKVNDDDDTTTRLTEESFARWIVEQTKLPMTSHRATFRRHLNHRFPADGITQVGRVTHPCQAGTRYRRSAFSDKDFGAWMEIRTVSMTTTQKALYVDSKLRTVVNATQFYSVHAETNLSQPMWDGM